MNNQKVILLNANYQYHDVITIEKAIKLIYRGVVEVVADTFYEIKTLFDIYKVPKVLKLNKIIKCLYNKGMQFNKKNVMVRDEYRCQYCGKFSHSLTIDHVVPKSRGGKNTFENTVACCSACNTKKDNKLPHEVGMKLLSAPKTPSINDFIIKKMKVLGVSMEF
jgi:hypothetical protein